MPTTWVTPAQTTTWRTHGLATAWRVGTPLNVEIPYGSVEPLYVECYTTAGDAVPAVRVALVPPGTVPELADWQAGDWEDGWASLRLDGRTPTGEHEVWVHVTAGRTSAVRHAGRLYVAPGPGLTGSPAPGRMGSAMPGRSPVPPPSGATGSMGATMPALMGQASAPPEPEFEPPTPSRAPGSMHMHMGALMGEPTPPTPPAP